MGDTEDGSVTMASPMNSKRVDHGLGVVTINSEERLAVFGGSDGNDEINSVELYDTQTGKGETTNIKLKEAKSGFGFISVKLSDVIFFGTVFMITYVISRNELLNKCHH